MGLDMYFERRHSVHNWKYTPPDERYTIEISRGGKVVPKTEIDPASITSIIEDAGYWRKANAIHQWFVENVQDGNDDCKEYRVSTEKMRELLARVNKVLAASELVPGKVQNGYTFKDGKEVPILVDGKRIKDPTVAKELLPTQEGFFFGGTYYDQWYVEDLERTKEILEEALARPGNYYYGSSW